MFILLNNNENVIILQMHVYTKKMIWVGYKKILKP